MKSVGQTPTDFDTLLVFDALKGAFIKTRQPQHLKLFGFTYK
jgi:hypothetical protein